MARHVIVTFIVGAACGAVMYRYKSELVHLINQRACYSERLTITPSAGERLRRQFDHKTVRVVEETFSTCGLVAISTVIAQDTVEDVAFHAGMMIGPLLESRLRVREASASPYSALPEAIKNEIFLASGEGFRERSSGRLDLLLPHSMPFNDTNLVTNAFITPSLRALFGSTFELKSSHAISSLPGSAAQHWHRDDEPIWTETRAYAVNVFVSLGYVSLDAGPTEFLPGTHLMADVAVQEIMAKGFKPVAFEWPPGMCS